MKTINEIREEIVSAEYEHRGAIAINAGISAAKERLKNLLFTYRSQIIEALKGQSEAEALVEHYKVESEMYSNELSAVDDENDELRHKIKELEMQIEQQQQTRSAKRTPKTKTMTAVVE